MTSQIINSIHERLTVLMKQEKPFLETKMSLPKTAKKLNTTIHLLSKTINKKEALNFFEFINKYRIDFACELIKSNNSVLSIEGIAYESGFGNKTSFNRAFKKFKGCTPSEYKKLPANK